MDIQNEILEPLGDQMTIEMLHEDFDGLTEQQVFEKLHKWFPTEDDFNKPLAEKIYQYLRSV